MDKHCKELYKGYSKGVYPWELWEVKRSLIDTAEGGGYRVGRLRKGGFIG